ncbi:MAG: TorF family putative porin [Planctomycetota bacterium]
MSTATAMDIAGEDVAVTADVTYASKYIWRGFALFGSQGAIQPSLDMALQNGLSFNVWASYATSSGYVDATEYNYTVAYSNSILEDCYQTDYTVGWRYYDYIDTSSKDADMQEIFAEIAMPNLVGNGITPHAAYYQMWNSQSGGANSGAAGAIFVLGATYDFTLEQAPELPMTFSWDVVYNDGTGASTVDHDWSHQIFGLSTSMDCPMTGGTITPGVYYQDCWESTVNGNAEELFATVSYALTF